MSGPARRLLLVLELTVLVLVAWIARDTLSAMLTRRTALFDLEWMEGATLVTGMRARDGLPFYTLPSADYVPFIYPPLYAWILGAMGNVATLDYPLARGFSLACTGVASLALLAGARGAGARWPLAWGAVGLFLASWVEGGTFYDLVRTDALALALLGGALVVAVRPSPRSTVAGGLLLAVAFMAKHHAAMFGFPIALALWRRDGWRRAALFGAAAAVPALAFTVAMQVVTDGLFVRYLLEVPGHHGIVAERALPNLDAKGQPRGAAWELWKALPVTTTLSLALLFRARNRLYWGGVFLTALVVSSLMRGHVGGYLNVLIPCLWVQALLPALVVGTDPVLDGAGGTPPATPPVGFAQRFGGWLPHLVTGTVAVQLWMARDSLERFVPTDADRAAAAKLVERVRALPGPVLSPHAPWLPVQAGHAPSLALIALWDIDHEGGPFRADVKLVPDAMAAHRWKTVLTPDDKLGYGLKEAYAPGPALGVQGPPTRTGWPLRVRKAWPPR